MQSLNHLTVYEYTSSHYPIMSLLACNHARNYTLLRLVHTTKPRYLVCCIIFLLPFYFLCLSFVNCTSLDKNNYRRMQWCSVVLYKLWRKDSKKMLRSFACQLRTARNHNATVPNKLHHDDLKGPIVNKNRFRFDKNKQNLYHSQLHQNMGFIV